MKNDRKSNKRNLAERAEDDGSERSSQSKGTTYKSKNKRNSRSRGGDSARRPDFRDTDRNHGSIAKVGVANDESWYTQSPEQVTNAANVSFVTSVGKPVQGATSNKLAGNSATPVNSASGVLRIGYMPTFGNPRNASDALNVGLQKTYADTRAHNSGTRVYYYPDFGKYIMVMDCAYAWAGSLIRAVGYLNSFSSVNKYLPKALFHAMGLDYEDIATQQPKFRLIVNNYISKINTLNVPNTLPVFNRHFWLGSNVYSDADNAWAQMYIHVPEVYAKYNYETANVDLIRFTPTISSPDYDTSLLKLDDIIRICDDITSSILLSETFSVMSGDIFKAYGSALFKIEGVSETFMLYPVYDAGVLNQIMNGTFVGNPKHAKTANVWSDFTAGETVMVLSENVDKGYLSLDAPDNSSGANPDLIPIFGNSTYNDGSHPNVADWYKTRQKLINITSLAPTPGMVLETTRTAAVTQLLKNNAYKLVSCGADVYTTFSIYYYTTESGILTLNHTEGFGNDFCLLKATDADTRGKFITVVDALTKLAHFDWHPIVNIILEDENAGVFKLASPFVDTFNTALVSNEVLQNMHDVANLSLFDVTIRNYNNGSK